MKGNAQILLFIIFLLVFFLSQYNIVCGEIQTEYSAEVHVDGSATWVIQQTGTNIPPPETLYDFINNVTSLIEAVKNQSGRNMTANKFKFTAYVADPYIVVKFQFEWENFSQIEQTKIIIGDVFEVEDFFEKLDGHGAFSLAYPSRYIVDTVWPEPYEQSDTLQKLGWVGTMNFGKGEPKIVLKRIASSGIIDVLQQNAIPIFALAIVTAAFSAGFYLLKDRKKKEIEIAKETELKSFPVMEDDKDKIVKLLISSGGSLYQSVIVDQCKFSKAKTSQLLAVLEDKKIVRRYKKGRDKIVVLLKQKR